MQPINPYQAPSVQHAPPSESALRLFTPRQTGIATFLGSALAGGVLLGLNAWRLGKPMHAVGYGVAGAALVGFLVFVVPDSVPTGATTGLGIGLAFGASALAKPPWESQPTPVRRSNWAVTGAVVGSLLFLIALVAGWILVEDGKKAFAPADSVEVPGGVVFHWDDVSEEEARTLADSLTELEYFDSSGEASVLFEREDGRLHLCFSVTEGSWNEAEVLDYYEDLAARIDDHVFETEGVRASLCNSDDEPKAVVYPR